MERQMRKLSKSDFLMELGLAASKMTQDGRSFLSEDHWDSARFAIMGRCLPDPGEYPVLGFAIEQYPILAAVIFAGPTQMGLGEVYGLMAWAEKAWEYYDRNADASGRIPRQEKVA